jgi:hypothetical protein
MTQMPMSEYLALPHFSASLAHILLTQSPYHARHAWEHRAEDHTDASDMGTAIHEALLEGTSRIFAIEATDWRTKAARELRDFARSQGGIPMLAHKVAAVEAAVKAVREQIVGTEIANVFNNGSPEQTITWDEDGMTCKCRPDWLSERWYLSVKTTTGSARPDAWIRRQLGPLGYDTSLAFYERGLRAKGWHGQSRILVIEQEPPHRISVIALAPSRQDYAGRRADRAIRTWVECMARNRWPSYPTETQIADLEPWELELALRDGDVPDLSWNERLELGSQA